MRTRSETNTTRNDISNGGAKQLTDQMAKTRTQQQPWQQQPPASQPSAGTGASSCGGIIGAWLRWRATLTVRHGALARPIQKVREPESVMMPLAANAAARPAAPHQAPPPAKPAPTALRLATHRLIAAQRPQATQHDVETESSDDEMGERFGVTVATNRRRSSGNGRSSSTPGHAATS